MSKISIPCAVAGPIHSPSTSPHLLAPPAEAWALPGLTGAERTAIR